MKKLFLTVFALLAFSISAFAAVNVNTATKEQLTTLKGIGPAKAQAIVDYRTKNGAFKTVEDVEKVPGIGPKIFANIKKDIALTGDTTVATPEKKDDKKAGKSDAKTAPTSVAPNPATAPSSTNITAPAPAAKEQKK